MTTQTTSPANGGMPSRPRFLRACATAVLLTGCLAGGAALAGTASASTDAADAVRSAAPDRNEITTYRVHASWRVPTTNPIPGLNDRVAPDPPAPFRATDDVPIYTGVFERWSAIEPLRDRSVWWFDLPEGGTGTTEESYAGGMFRWWTSWQTDPPQERRLSDDDIEWYENERLGRARVWMHNTTWTADPIGGIRTMYDNGMLESTGRTTFQGRSVLRLVGEQPGTAQNQSPGGPIRYEYLVDPRTFAPVRVSGTFTERGPDQNGENAERYISTFTFLAFDTLPLNDETRHLLVAGSGH